REPAPSPGSRVEQELVARLVEAFQSGDVDSLVALLTDDVVVSMPPVPLEYHGREHAAQFHATVTFRHGRTLDLVPTRANGQLACGMYVRAARGGARLSAGLMVLPLVGSRISGMTRFDTSVLSYFGLPRRLPG